jgi:hypothetical protein
MTARPTTEEFLHDEEGWIRTLDAGQVVILLGEEPASFQQRDDGDGDEWTYFERMDADARLGGMGDNYLSFQARSPSIGRPDPRVAGRLSNSSIVEETTLLAYPGDVNDYAFTVVDGQPHVRHQLCGHDLGAVAVPHDLARLADDHASACPIAPGVWEQEY